MAFNQGLDVTIDHVYNGAYGFPFQQGELYTNPANQTFRFTEIGPNRSSSTGADIYSIITPGFFVTETLEGKGAMNVVTEAGAGGEAGDSEDQGRILGLWTGSSAVYRPAGSSLKQGVWVQCGGKIAGDAWVTGVNIDGVGGTSATNPNGGLSGKLSSSVTGLLEFDPDVERATEIGTVPAGGVSVYFAGTSASDNIHATSASENPVNRGLDSATQRVLLIVRNINVAASALTIAAMVPGSYVDIGDKDLSSGSSGPNSITIKIEKQIKGVGGSLQGDYVAAVGHMTECTDASGATRSTLYLCDDTHTDATLGSLSQIDGTKTPTTTAGTATTRAAGVYTDQTNGTSGLSFKFAISSQLTLDLI